MSWGYEVNFHEDERKPRAGKYIHIYDPQVDCMVWLEWNGSKKSPRVYRWNQDTSRMWWMEWDVEGNERTEDEIPSVQGPDFSHSANYRPLSKTTLEVKK